MRLRPLNTDEIDPLSADTEAERELGRALTLLQENLTGYVTLAELRERGITAPAQTVYELQLAGYTIERITSTAVGVRMPPGYRMHEPVADETDQPAGYEEFVSSDHDSPATHDPHHRVHQHWPRRRTHPVETRR